MERKLLYSLLHNQLRIIYKMATNLLCAEWLKKWKEKKSKKHKLDELVFILCLPAP